MVGIVTGEQAKPWLGKACGHRAGQAGPRTLTSPCSWGFTSNLSFCYLAQELLPPDGGEGEAPEEEERGAGGDRQAPGGESPQTAGGKPQSGECTEACWEADLGKHLITGTCHC